MRQAGVLSRVLPESEKWGIDAIHALVKTERDLGWMPDPLLRLEAIVPPDRERLSQLAARLKLSKAETERLLGVGGNREHQRLHERSGICQEALSRCDARDRRPSAPFPCRGPKPRYREHAGFDRGGRVFTAADYAGKWQRPEFPVKGSDLAEIGLKQGPELGAVLKALETAWIESGFALDRGALLARAAEGIKA